ncbi:MAG TPA: dihydroorotase family protein [Candidatus Paceibacterota bacterium]|nr:dihydroorotase family protein [Candidatus Paceibacterota bacterium]
MKEPLVVDTVLYNAKVFIGGELLKAGVAIDGSKIVKVAKEPNLPPASNKIDLHGCVVLPGLIDVHVHLRGQLQACKENFATGTAAAVVGGITSVLDMPNNKPVTMNSTSLRKRMRAAERDIVANVGFFSAFPESLEEIDRLVEGGAVGFKLYLTKQIGGVDIDDDEALLHAFSRASELGVPVAVHAEDKGMIETLSEAEQKLGHKNVEAYLKAHTPEVEAKAVERILRIVLKSRVQIHFCHVSSEKAIILIDNARKTGLRVSCEVTPHHLLLTSEDLRRNGAMMLTDPPVRQRSIVNMLWDALKKGRVDVIASDHAPHMLAEKEAESVWDVKPGIPGLETLLPLLLTKVNEGQLSLAELVRLTAENPAKTFHLHGDGFLKEGYNANITVVDMHRQGKIEVNAFHSKSKHSPFEGWSVRGLPLKTFVNGKLVMNEGELVAERGAGRIMR